MHPKRHLWLMLAVVSLVGCDPNPHGPSVPPPPAGASAGGKGSDAVIEKGDGKVPKKTGPTATLND